MYGNKSLMVEDKEAARSSLVLYDSLKKSAQGSLSPSINLN